MFFTRSQPALVLYSSRVHMSKVAVKWGRTFIYLFIYFSWLVMQVGKEKYTATAGACFASTTTNTGMWLLMHFFLFSSTLARTALSLYALQAFPNYSSFLVVHGGRICYLTLSIHGTFSMDLCYCLFKPQNIAGDFHQVLLPIYRGHHEISTLLPNCLVHGQRITHRHHSIVHLND